MAELWREKPAQPLQLNIDDSNSYKRKSEIVWKRFLFFSLLTDTSPGERSKNGYMFQEMGV